MNEGPCQKCGKEPRSGKNKWGKGCLAAAKREERQARKGKKLPGVVVTVVEVKEALVRTAEVGPILGCTCSRVHTGPCPMAEPLEAEVEEAVVGELLTSGPSPKAPRGYTPGVSRMRAGEGKAAGKFAFYGEEGPKSESLMARMRDGGRKPEGTVPFCVTTRRIVSLCTQHHPGHLVEMR